jgi:hypothetical protein
MLLAEETFHFSIKSFGPFAALLVVVLLGITMFGLLHGAGLSMLSSVSVAYVAVFFSTRAVSPEFYDWLTETMPLLSIAALISLVAALFTTVGGFFSGHSIPHAWQGQGQASPQAQVREKNRRHAMDGESLVLRKHGNPTAKRSVEESKNLLTGLKAVREEIRKHGDNPAARQRIVRQMKEVLPTGRALYQDIEKMRSMNERLVAFDESVFHEDLKAKMKEMDPAERERIKGRLHAELGKLGVGKKLTRVEEAMKEHLREVARAVQECGGFLMSGDKKKALAVLDKAIAAEHELNTLAREAKHLESTLLSLTQLRF